MTKQSKNPMTKEGYEKLYGEFETLSKVERPKVVKGVSDAAAEGDRSENAEYIYGKKRLREIDKRLQYLSRLLGDAKIIDTQVLSGDVVCFGATVVVCDEDGGIKRWKIVGDGEADMREGSISVSSPVGKALMGKAVGTFVEIERPKDVINLEIIGIMFAGQLIAGRER